MTHVLFTVDTELSARLYQDGRSTRANFESSILGRTDDGDVGVGWQMDLLERHGLKGVFFVDPLPSLVLGEQVIADIVGPLAARGHDVQLHAHTEWLQWATESPVGGRTGRTMADFSLADQIALLRFGRDVLIRAGADRPIAFRAGNFGANDDTLRALAAIGLSWDSSLNADYRSGACRIDVAATRNLPLRRCGIVELPVSGLIDRPGHVRPAQICAVSRSEMRVALAHAASRDHPVFTIVTHSFEAMSRDRMRANRTVMRRFLAVAQAIAADPRLHTARIADLGDEVVRDDDDDAFAASNRARTALRMAEQGWATLRYERRLRPA